MNSLDTAGSCRHSPSSVSETSPYPPTHVSLLRCTHVIFTLRFTTVLSIFVSRCLRVMNVVKTLIWVLLIFFVFFSGKVLKVSNNYRCAFKHIDALMNALRYISLF